MGIINYHYIGCCSTIHHLNITINRTGVINYNIVLVILPAFAGLVKGNFTVVTDLEIINMPLFKLY